MSKQSSPPDEEDRETYTLEDAYYVRSRPDKNLQKESELVKITKKSRKAYDYDSDGDNDEEKVDLVCGRGDD
jgi:hypothetical protein